MKSKNLKTKINNQKRTNAQTLHRIGIFLHKNEKIMSIFNHFNQIKLSNDQEIALIKIQEFLNNDTEIFLLKGYAGSGKTTLLKGIIEYLNHEKRLFLMMAPTGRAAKVIHQRTGYEAKTIHKSIYSFENIEEIEIVDNEKGSFSFIYNFQIRHNKEIQSTILLIDEASMISNVENQGEFFRFGSGRLLDDLIEFSRKGTISKIIFIGDPAQLPPIGMNISPALDANYLIEIFHSSIEQVEMKEIKRQDSNNGILNAASKIRSCLTTGFYSNFDLRSNHRDLFEIEFNNFIEIYKQQQSSKVVVTYKNKTAQKLNQMIRNDKYKAQLPIQKSDIVIVSANNYCLSIMNGEFGVVLNADSKVISREIKFKNQERNSVSVKLSWRYIELFLPDQNGNNATVNGYLLDNFLNGENLLKSEEQTALYIDFKNRHPELKQHTEEFTQALSQDPFFNCILLKYGYAVTCHKAQGGEWDCVFVMWDKGNYNSVDFFNTPHDSSGKTNSDFFRWGYTAITRATKQLYSINPPYFNSLSKISIFDSSILNSVREIIGNTNERKELEITYEMKKKLEEFKLENTSSFIQNHFLLIQYILENHLIQIIRWKRIGYEIRYLVKRDQETASLKFWINSKDQFNDKIQKIDSETNSDSFFKEVLHLIQTAPNISFINVNNQSYINNFEIENEISEKMPFLKELFDSIRNSIVKSNIYITDINHHNYRERYRFQKENEKVVLDFIYNQNGFFVNVFPIETLCNSKSLLDLLKDSIMSIKTPNYVI